MSLDAQKITFGESQTLRRRNLKRFIVLDDDDDGEDLPRTQAADAAGTAPAPSQEDVNSTLEQLQDDSNRAHSESLGTWLASARESASTSRPQPTFPHTQSPFPASAANQSQAESAQSYSVVGQTILTTKKVRKHIFRGAVHPTTYRSSVGEIPHYIDYTTVRESVLSKNDLTLRAWPELEDEKKQDELEKTLEDHFPTHNPRTRAALLPERVKAVQLQSYLRDFINSMGISINDVLRYLLEPDPELLNLLPESHHHILDERDKYCAFEVDRQSTESIKSLSKLSASPVGNIMLAHLACAAIKNVLGIRMWPVAKMLAAKWGESTGSTEQQRWLPSLKFQEAMQCRICFMIDCKMHGEYKEDPDDVDSDPNFTTDTSEANNRLRITTPVSKKRRLNKSASERFFEIGNDIGQEDDGTVIGGDTELSSTQSIYPDADLCSNSCFWKITNRDNASSAQWTDSNRQLLERMMFQYAREKRAPCIMAHAFPHSCAEVFQEAKVLKDTDAFHDQTQTAQPNQTKAKRPRPRSRLHKQTRKTRSNPIRKWTYFVPCDHDGPCDNARCTCHKNQMNCEKFCRCAASCERRFKGCKCRRSGHPCRTDQCPCYLANRECDPDLCRSCGSLDTLEPLNRQLARITEGRCCNVAIQRNVPKHTYLGKSQIVGYGLYAGEPLRAGDFIGEYKGELVTEDELVRREDAYYYRDNLYTFKLGESGPHCDAHHRGNKLRHVNHSSDKHHQNCFVKQMQCGSIVRMGMFAKRDVEDGEELLFDYGYAQEYLRDHSFVEKDGALSADRSAVPEETT